MPSVLAIVSKAVFEKLVPKDVAVGSVMEIDRYASSQAAFEQVGKGDSIFLVTVRPPHEALWLIAVLDKVKHAKGAWIGSTNTHPITDITPLIKQLKFATGTGITANKGALGMSLQTPRVVTDDDVALLRGGTPAVAEYRKQVDATPAGSKAKAQARAAARDGEALRLVNYRRPFQILGKLAKPQLAQLAQLTRQNRAGKPAELVDDEDWAPMELVDVLDVGSNVVTHQLYIWPWGSGELFVHDTRKRAGAIIQHGLDLESEDRLFRRALAAAYVTAKPQLAETVDFGLDRVAPVPPEQAAIDEVKLITGVYKGLVKVLGRSKERYRVFEQLTKAQQQAIRDAFRTVSVELLAQRDLEALGLPPVMRLRAWCGHSPRSELEQRAGKWPVWKWLKEASASKVTDAAAIAAITKALTRDQILELGRMVCDPFYDYDLWGEHLKYHRGESVANRHQTHVAKLIGALVDAAGDGAALTFAEAARKHLENDATFWLAAVAGFALAGRARRRKEPFPSKYVALAIEADFLGHGAHLREGMRDIVETMKPADRVKTIIDDSGPFFTTSYDDEVKKGREYEVPCVLHAWYLVDLAPTDEIVEAMVDSIVEWDKDRKPTESVLDIIAKVGAVAIPHLKKALAKKSPHKRVLEQALARLT